MKSYLEELERYSSTLDGWDTAIKYEYKIISQTVDDIVSGEMGPPEIRKETLKLRLGKFRYLLLSNNTKHRFAEYSRTIIENGRKPFADKTSLKPDETKSRWKQILTRNFIGKMLVDILIPSFQRALGVKCRDNISVAATRCLIALKCYQIDHSGLPESLTQLVPAYLDAVPLDDFDGKPLRYNREKKILYSVGEDLIDNGGVANPQDRLKEIVYKIEF